MSGLRQLIRNETSKREAHSKRLPFVVRQREKTKRNPNPWKDVSRFYLLSGVCYYKRQHIINELEALIPVRTDLGNMRIAFKSDKSGYFYQFIHLIPCSNEPVTRDVTLEFPVTEITLNKCSLQVYDGMIGLDDLLPRVGSKRQFKTIQWKHHFVLDSSLTEEETKRLFSEKLRK